MFDFCTSRIRPVLFCLAWTIIAAISTYDCYFAWKFRAGFQKWELNPLARTLAHSHGLAIVLAAKAAALLFAASIAVYCYRHRQWLDTPYTLTVCAVHLALGAHYLAGYLQHPWH